MEHRSEPKTSVHPVVGHITLDCDVFTAAGTDLRIVAYTAVPGSEDASRFDLLRTLGATSDSSWPGAEPPGVRPGGGCRPDEGHPLRERGLMADERGSDEGFSDAERAAMQQRKAELREQAKAGKGSAKKEREAQACRDAIAALDGTDRAVAERLHAIVTDEAPHLDPKTWYGFPGPTPATARSSSSTSRPRSSAPATARSASARTRLDDGVLGPRRTPSSRSTTRSTAASASLVRRAA